MRRKISERKERKILAKLDPDYISPIPRRGEKVPCIIPEVYDGDTLTAVYLYQGAPLKIRVRLSGVDAPEIRKKNVTDLERKAALKVREFVQKWLDRSDPKKLYLQLSQHDKYGGRFVGDILKNISETSEPVYQSLSTTLLEADMVVPYTGSTKQEWESKKLRKIIKHSDEEN